MATNDRFARILDHALRNYKTRPERAALRCALGDASGLCDAIARDLEAEHRDRRGNGAVTKRGAELAAVARRCGDAIWEMRGRVGFEDKPR